MRGRVARLCGFFPPGSECSFFTIRECKYFWILVCSQCMELSDISALRYVSSQRRTPNVFALTHYPRVHCVAVHGIRVKCLFMYFSCGCKYFLLQVVRQYVRLYLVQVLCVNLSTHKMLAFLQHLEPDECWRSVPTGSLLLATASPTSLRCPTVWQFLLLTFLYVFTLSCKQTNNQQFYVTFSHFHNSSNRLLFA